MPSPQQNMKRDAIKCRFFKFRQHGPVRSNRFPHLTLLPGQDLPFLCGNPAMIDDAVAWLSEAGFGPRQVKAKYEERRH
jgi:NAD(P)H-flavin reductase